MTSPEREPLTQPPVIVQGALIIPYRYALGQTASRFYIELRDHRRLMATQCHDCGKTYLPPVSTCLECATDDMEWREVGSSGVVTTYTVDRRELSIQPGERGAKIYALVRLDGADTDLFHLLGGLSPGDVRIGMRVRAVFRGKRQGNILDIQHFTPEDAE